MKTLKLVLSDGTEIAGTREEICNLLVGISDSPRRVRQSGTSRRRGGQNKIGRYGPDNFTSRVGQVVKGVSGTFTPSEVMRLMGMRGSKSKQRVNAALVCLMRRGETQRVERGVYCNSD
jgi:hypothetical protein